ncbi:MAG: alpha/beta hydrolase family protein [Myxococcota bacterium]
MKLSHWTRASRIVWAMARPRPLPMREVFLDLGDASGLALVYDPVGTPVGTVVIIPGMTVSAHRDERLHNLAIGFARGGFRGLVLEVPDLQRLKIRAETDADVARRITALLPAGLAPEGRIGLLGPSFSGSLALRAATMPGAAGWVRAVITVGAYAEATSTVRYLFESTEADPYGRLILLLNFLSEVEPVTEGQSDALHAAILDTSREVKQLASVLRRLPREQADRLEAILTDPAVWGSVGERFLDSGSGVLDPLSVPPIVHKLQCAVMMLHGASDNIVPPSESHVLKEALDAGNVPNHLLVTSVLDHANIQGGFTAAREALGMVKAFAFFVQAMAQD